MDTKEIIKVISELNYTNIKTIFIEHTIFEGRIVADLRVDYRVDPVKCPICNGTTNKPGSSVVPCLACNGHGYI
jgi:DnaJ-class molecular chaperone